MSHDPNDALIRVACRDCGLTVTAAEYPSGWVSEKGYEQPQHDRCPACYQLHRGATRRVEAAAPPAVTRKRVFVASPFKGASLGERVDNYQRAVGYCRDVVDAGHAPFAPHVLYPFLLDEDTPEERAAGIACGMAFLAVCDELWAWSTSPGVEAEVAAAERLGIVVRRMTA
jgi:hypothetical protein